MLKADLWLEGRGSGQRARGGGRGQGRAGAVGRGRWVRKNGGVNQKRNLPAYMRTSLIALVFAGGIAGVLARELLMLAIPALAGIPLAVFVANVIGAFFLGCLLEALAVSAEESRRQQTLRLLLGTGFLGGFTTYSAVAQSAVLMLAGGDVYLAIVYPLGTIVLGALASWCGILCALRVRQARSRRAERGGRS